MSNYVLGYEKEGNKLPAFDIEVAQRAGRLHVRADAIRGIQDLMRETAATMDRSAHQTFGAALLPPIRLLARYKAWTQEFLMPQSFELGEDNRIAIDAPLGSAFLTAPGGRIEYVTPGVQRYVRPTFSEISGGLFIHWSTLEYAKWNVLQRRLEEIADAMAKKKDDLVKPVLDAAIASVGHTVTSSGSWTKASIDTVYAQAAGIGFPITHVAINPQRRADMANWTNGSTSALPVFFSPEDARQEVYRQLWYTGYLNLRYFESKDVPLNTIYLAGDPPETGYVQDHGAIKSVSDMKVEDRGDLHLFWMDVAAYVANPYNLWAIQIV